MKADDSSRRDFLRFLAAAGLLPLLPRTARAQADEVKEKPKAPGVHRILTCNILLDLPEQKGTPLDWAAHRREACLTVIKSRNADILCLQEVGYGQNSDFSKAFPGYVCFGYADPYVDTRPRRFQTIKNVILFSKERYELASAGTWWYTETPLIAGSRMKGEGLPRHVTWVRLTDRTTGRDFRVLNTHWDLKPELRMKQSEMLRREAEQYPPSFPQLLCGDLNSLPASPEQKNLLDGGWSDSFEAVHGFIAPGLPAHDQAGPADLPTTGRRKIDFIYCRGRLKPAAADIISDQPNGYPPSDHNFVSADVEI